MRIVIFQDSDIFKGGCVTFIYGKRYSITMLSNRLAFAVCLAACMVSMVSPAVQPPSCLESYAGETRFDDYRLPEHRARDLAVPDAFIDGAPIVAHPVPCPAGEGALWPMEGHDATHTGRSAHCTEDNYGQDLWSCMTRGGLYGSPVVDAQQTVYFGSSYFYAVNGNGTLKWEYKTSGWIETAPAIGSDGTIYVGTSRGYDDHFYALNPNGSCKWSIRTSSIHGSPAIASDGTIVFPDSHNNKLVAVHPNGTKKWEFATGHVIYSTPAVGPDGSVYFGSHDRRIYALHPNGTLKWSHLTGNWVHGSPSIAADGTVYCSSDDDHLYAFDPDDGSLRWKMPIGASYSSPTIGPDGTLYIGVWQKRFYAINPNGTIKWAFDTSPGKVWSCTAALSADGTLYFATADLEWSGGVELIALWTNGTVKCRRPFGSEWSSPAIGRDGTVYIGNRAGDDSELKAVGYGPLRAEANGPYTGDDYNPLPFTGSAFGGMPPFAFHWDFGDGGTSSEQNPAHRYESIGTFTATFTIRDSYGNESVDSASVTVTYALPSITLVKPVYAIYIMNVKTLPFKLSPIVIGPIVVTVEAYQEPFGINRVEFSLNDALVFTDTEAPYRWLWVTPTFCIPKLGVRAIDNSGNCSRVVETRTLKIF